MDYKLTFNNWISNPLLTAEAYEELNSIKDDLKEIEYRFGKELEFGTAGMRGLIGYGTNMINVYTVKRATKGLAEYVKSLGYLEMERGVVISYDTRKNSKVFAKACAGVLIKNGVNVKIFKNPSPVPMLSYAIKRFNAVAGIMITASHNPKEYNGYKVYGENGAQASVETTQKIVSYINEVTDWLSIEEVPVNELKKQRGLAIIGNRFLKRYVKTICKQALSKKAVKKQGKKVKIVYTPLHGTGYSPVTAVLKNLNINVSVVKEQTVEDENFSTVEIPNPECKEAFNMAISVANKISANVIFGTDPDADRLGVAIRNLDGEFVNLTGNQTGILLTDYVLKRLVEENKLPKNGVVIKSYVSSGMAKYICDCYGVKLEEVPVGFKYVGEKIDKYEKDKSKSFIFAFEESCGYLKGTHSYDKDAIVASMLFAEMACYYANLGVSIYSVLIDLYEKYGYYIDKISSINYSGISAVKETNSVVEKIRKSKISSVGGYKILATRDYLTGERIQADGDKTNLEYCGINCLYYELEIGGFICVRPSGTEPKLRVYYSVRGKDLNIATTALNVIEKEFSKLLK